MNGVTNFGDDGVISGAVVEDTVIRDNGSALSGDGITGALIRRRLPRAGHGCAMTTRLGARAGNGGHGDAVALARDPALQLRGMKSAPRNVVRAQGQRRSARSFATSPSRPAASSA